MLPYENVILMRRVRKTGKEIPEEENRDLIADQRTAKAVGTTRSWKGMRWPPPELRDRRKAASHS